MSKKCKKIIFIGLGVIGGAALVAGIGLYLYIQSMKPAPEERIAHHNDQLIASIDRQLEGIDLDAVKAKKELIFQQDLATIQTALTEKKLSHEELVAYYLMTIKEIDQSPEGNNAISEINPNAMEEARHYDQATSNLSLAGIPVVVKENINTKDMPTSAGSYALKDFIPQTDAAIVQSLKEHGAIILGKTNLSEMSHWMSTKNPSGYSAKKGQTTNPFDPLTISPLGSSSGSAVAMATDLATLSIGTETSGSIIAPASVNSVVGYKPTRGAISGEGIIPITYSLDTVGSITKTVADSLAVYQATASEPLAIRLNPQALKGKRIGLLKSSDADFEETLAKQLRSLGAEVEVIEIDRSQIDTKFILLHDFEKDLNHYLSTYHAPVQSLEELIAFNKEAPTVRMRYGQNLLEESLNFKDHNPEKVTQIIQLAQSILTQQLTEKRLDAIVFKDNDGADLTATAGAPEVAVPFGKTGNQPRAATFVTDVNQDALALEIAYSFEQGTHIRELP